MTRELFTDLPVTSVNHSPPPLTGLFSSMTHSELHRTVEWSRPNLTGHPVIATFNAVHDGAELLVVRLVRITAGSSTISRNDALTLGQPVADWEAQTVDFLTQHPL